MIGGNVSFGPHTLTVGGSRPVTFQGLTGSSTAGSRLVKTGTGLLRLDTSAILITNQPFTLTTGTLDVDGFLQVPVTMTGGTLTGQGNLGLALDASGGDIVPDSGDLDVAGAATLRGSVNLRVSLLGPGDEAQLSCGGSLTIQDQATLEVTAAAYTPVRGDIFQIIQKSPAGAIAGAFVNVPASAEFSAGGSVLRFSYTGGNGNDLTLSTISTTRTWTGGATFNDNWDDPDNWAGNTAPLAGDTLVFPAGIQSSDRGLDNNFPNDTVFRQIVFNGDDFTVRGNRLRLTHGIVLGFTAGQANFDVDVVLAASQTFSFGVGPGNDRKLHFDALDNVDTNGRTLTLAGAGRMDSSINGSGGVTFATGSNVSMTAVNGYDGLTRVQAGGYAGFGRLPFTTVDYAPGSAAGPSEISGELHINNDMEAFIPMQIPETFLLNPGGGLYTRGSIWTGGVSTENLNGDIVLQGPGGMTLDCKEGGLTNLDGGISGIGDLVIRTNAGILREYLPVTLRGNSPNTFAGSLTLELGKLILDKRNGAAVPCAALTIAEGSDAFPSIVETQGDEQIADNCHVSLAAGTKLQIGQLTARTETIGSLTADDAFVGHEGTEGPDSLLVIGGNLTALGERPFFNLEVHLTGTPCILNAAADTTCVFNKTLVRTGAGSLLKTGSGKVVFGGTTAIPMELRAGTVLFHNTATGSAISLNGGTLGGFGPCGPITAGSGGGKIAPSPQGVIDPNTAVLVTGTLILNSATTLATEVKSNVTGTGFDQVSVVGSVFLNDATLGLQYVPGFDVPLGQSIFPILNDGTDPVVGTFAGLPQGAFIDAPDPHAGGWIISYTGGTGNDVSLTRVAAAPVTPRLATVIFSRGTGPGGKDQVALTGTANANQTLSLLASTDLINWTTLQSVTATGTGAVTVIVSQNPGIPKRFFYLLP